MTMSSPPARSTTRRRVRRPAGPANTPRPTNTGIPRPAAAAAPAPVVGFADLGVPPALVDSLARLGIRVPFPIQSATLPDALAGRDVLGRGRTGSGKTVAFALPIAVRLAGPGTVSHRGAPRGLVLVPTRELAIQVNDTLAPLAAAMGLTTHVIVGGVGQAPQVAALRRGVDVLVATPGRLEDLVGQGHARLDAVEVCVLDEADHLADLGFLPAVRRLLDRTPPRGQRLLFSATIDASVDVLVRRYLRDPVTHSVDSAASPVPRMSHHVVTVSGEHKPAVVRELVSGRGRTLAFTRTKHGAKKLARQLTAAGIPAVDLHGNLSQGQRQRNLAAFADGSVRVLVATDIAARGIHVDGIGLVVHVDPPAEHKAYLHRSGRTARAGADGVVVTVGTPDQRTAVAALLRQAAITPEHHAVTPGQPIIRSIAGPPADLVTPVTASAGAASARATSPGRVPVASTGRSTGGRRRRSR